MAPSSAHTTGEEPNHSTALRMEVQAVIPMRSAS